MGRRVYKSLLLLYLISLGLYSGPSIADNYLPGELDSLLKMSDGVFWVQFNDYIEKKKLSSGRFVYIGHFTVIKSISIPRSKVVNKNNLSIIISSEFDRNFLPTDKKLSFKKGEKALLIVKLTKQGFQAADFNLSKLEISQTLRGGHKEISLMVSFFNRDETFTMNLFETAMMKYFGHKFEGGLEDLKITQPNRNIKYNSGRLPASHLDEQNDRKKIIRPYLSLFWLTTFLIVMGFMRQFVFSRK